MNWLRTQLARLNPWRCNTQGPSLVGYDMQPFVDAVVNAKFVTEYPLLNKLYQQEAEARQREQEAPQGQE